MNTASLLSHNKQLLNACRDGNLAQVKSLLSPDLSSQVQVNCQDELKCTPLHIAASKNHTTIVRLLIEQGANVNAENSLSSTPLHYAAANDSAESANLLLQHPLIDIDKRDNYGYTPLHIAVKKSFTETIVALLKNNADLNVKRSGCGSTALHFAVEYGFDNVVEILLEYGALTSVMDEAKRTPLMKSVEQFSEKESNTSGTQLLVQKERRLIRQMRCWLLLLAFDDKALARKDGNRRNIIHKAAWYGNASFLRTVSLFVPTNEYLPLLLEVDSVNGCTPLHLAAEQGNSECVSTLCLMQPKACSTQDKNLNTPLHVSCIRMCNLRTLSEDGLKAIPSSPFREVGITKERDLFYQISLTLIKAGSDVTTFNKTKTSAKKMLETLNSYKQIQVERS